MPTTSSHATPAHPAPSDDATSDDATSRTAMAALSVVVDCRGPWWTLRIAGELDIATGDQLVGLGRVLGEGQTALVEIDLSGLDFVDSAGLRAVARTCALVRAGGGVARVTGAASPALDRLLGALDRCGRPGALGDTLEAAFSS